MRTFLKAYFRTRYIDRSYDRNALQRYQDRLLEKLLRNARANVPFQASRISSPKSTLLDIEPIDKRKMMEMMTDTVDHQVLKRRGLQPRELSDFMSNYHESVSPIFDDFFVLSETSGTSGSKGIFWRTRKELALRDGIKLAREGGKRALAKYLRRERLRKAILYSGETFSSSHQNVEDLKRKFSRFTEIRTFPNSLTFHEIVEGLSRFDPHHIYGYPISLVQLAEYVLEHEIHLVPSVVRSGAAQLSEEARLLLARAFPEARIINHYAATECAPIAGSCVNGKMHLFEDSVVMECMNDAGEAVRMGEFSNHILVTSLTRSFQPIIRYKIEDAVRILPDACTCGSILPLIEIRGRTFLRFKIVDNFQNWSSLTSPQFIDSFYQLPMVGEYQVRYEERNKFKIHLYQPRTELQHFEAEFAAEINEHFRQLLMNNNCESTVTVDLKFLAENEKKIGELAYYSFE